MRGSRNWNWKYQTQIMEPAHTGEFLKVQCLVLSYFSHISMICTSPLSFSLNPYYFLMTWVLLFPEIDCFQNCVTFFASFIEWFKVNKHTLNCDGTNLMKFCISDRICIIPNTGCDNKTTEEVETTEFLCLQTDNNLSWKIQTYIIQH